MSEGVLDRDRFEAIEAYVLGTMPGEERVRFEQQMTGDSELRSEVKLQRENMLAIELGGIERMLEQVASEQRETPAAGRWSSSLKYAAVVVLLLGIGSWLMLRPSADERLFAEHYVADPGLPVTMGATTDQAFLDAMVDYKLGSYKQARDKWSPLLQADPTNDTLRFYIANASLAMDDNGRAVALFEALANETGSTFRDKSRWYLFLAYVKTGDHARAEALPLDHDPTYGERVRAIKAGLR